MSKVRSIIKEYSRISKIENITIGLSKKSTEKILAIFLSATSLITRKSTIWDKKIINTENNLAQIIELETLRHKVKEIKYAGG